MPKLYLGFLDCRVYGINISGTPNCHITSPPPSLSEKACPQAVGHLFIIFQFRIPFIHYPIQTQQSSPITSVADLGDPSVRSKTSWASRERKWSSMLGSTLALRLLPASSHDTPDDVGAGRSIWLNQEPIPARLAGSQPVLAPWLVRGAGYQDLFTENGVKYWMNIPSVEGSFY